jgi:hypothetical protein
MHHSVTSLLCLLCKNMASGVAINSPEHPGPICKPYLAGMMHTKLFPSTGTVTTQLLGLIHANLAYLSVCTPSGYRYFVGFHNDASSFHALYPLRTKDPTFYACCVFKVWAEKQTGRHILALQNNKGGKFVGGRWDVFFTLHGIKHRRSIRNRAEQNGVAECANCTIVDGVTAVLAQSSLHSLFWGEALAAFVHVYNRLPLSSMRGKSLKVTPHELWYGTRPDLLHLQAWGCKAYAHVQRDVRNKLQWHMVKCVIISYPDDYKGWKFWGPIAKKAIICKSVVFDKQFFPMSKLAQSTPSFCRLQLFQICPQLLRITPRCQMQGEMWTHLCLLHLLAFQQPFHCLSHALSALHCLLQAKKSRILRLLACLAGARRVLHPLISLFHVAVHALVLLLLIGELLLLLLFQERTSKRSQRAIRAWGSRQSTNRSKRMMPIALRMILVQIITLLGALQRPGRTIL